MAGDKVGLVHQVRTLDRPRAEADVRGRDRAGLARIVHEVALGVQRRVFADDLHRVAVGTHRAVAAEAEKHRAKHVVFLGREVGIVIEAQLRHVIDDADDELVLRLRLGQLVVNAGDHRGGKLLRRQAVTAANDLRQRRRGPLSLWERARVRAFPREDRSPNPLPLSQRERGEFCRPTLDQGRDHVLIQRFAGGAGLFRAIEHGDPLDRLRQRRDHGARIPGAKQPDNHHADFLALGNQLVDRLLDYARPRAHDDDHALGVGSADVVEQVILPADELWRTCPCASARCRRTWHSRYCTPRGPGRRRRGSGPCRGASAARAKAPGCDGPRQAPCRSSPGSRPR